ncbi:hypothetical protein [Candidatus Deianiraea vastatrix]|uniref:Uncharacterized protein n=1 Tax=Candidatus Deianiraea vastatrix TaxID=2163644 RepID=A0A5B8XFY4_9RICK|nr:hypothetical protein [Candidatus Deianiraea vastatrix]QED23826.1 hypothetical protein Deia_01044 [Candidatus Deianiraea vastatrix]
MEKNKLPVPDYWYCNGDNSIGQKMNNPSLKAMNLLSGEFERRNELASMLGCKVISFVEFLKKKCEDADLDENDAANMVLCYYLKDVTKPKERKHISDVLEKMREKNQSISFDNVNEVDELMKEIVKGHVTDSESKLASYKANKISMLNSKSFDLPAEINISNASYNPSIIAQLIGLGCISCTDEKDIYSISNLDDAIRLAEAGKLTINSEKLIENPKALKLFKDGIAHSINSSCLRENNGGFAFLSKGEFKAAKIALVCFLVLVAAVLGGIGIFAPGLFGLVAGSLFSNLIGIVSFVVSCLGCTWGMKKCYDAYKSLKKHDRSDQKGVVIDKSLAKTITMESSQDLPQRKDKKLPRLLKSEKVPKEEIDEKGKMYKKGDPYKKQKGNSREETDSEAGTPTKRRNSAKGVEKQLKCF